jgi:TonB family protein
MKQTIKTTYNRIGAYELKASYQRNMLMSTLLIATIALLAAFYFTTDKSDATPTGQLKIPDTIIVTLGPQPTIIKTRPLINRVDAYKKKSMGTIPIPIPDDELPDDWEDQTIYSQQDLADFINSQYDSIDFSVGNFIYEPPDDDGYIGANDFQSVEIYPEMIYEEIPLYPRLAKTAYMEADVWIKALVDIDGSVVKAIIFKSSGSNIGFGSAALDAAFLCKYSPGIQNGIPVPVWVCYKVEFRLKDR